MAMADSGSGRVDVVVDHAPETRVVHANDPSHGRHGHALDKREHQGLEEKGEAAPCAGPRHMGELDPAAGAGDPRHARIQVSLVLEEVEVTPRLLRGVVRGALLLPALRAGEPSAPAEVEVEVEPLDLRIELGTLHEPRALEPKSHLEEIHVPHADSLRSPKTPRRAGRRSRAEVRRHLDRPTSIYSARSRYRDSGPGKLPTWNSEEPQRRTWARARAGAREGEGGISPTPIAQRPTPIAYSPSPRVLLPYPHA